MLRADKANAKRAEIPRLQAIITFQRKGADAAAQELRQAMNDCDNPSLLAMQLAEWLEGQGKHNEAIEVCRQAIQKKPSDAVPRKVLATLQSKGGDVSAPARRWKRLRRYSRAMRRSRPGLPWPYSA